MRESVVFLLLPFQLLGEELQLALELAFEQKVNENIVIFLIELVFHSYQLEKRTVFTLLLIQHVQSMK